MGEKWNEKICRWLSQSDGKGSEVPYSLPEKVSSVFDSVMRLYSNGIQFHSMTVSDIAKEAGIGKGTVYEYFDTKEEIIWNAVAFHCKKTMELVCSEMIKKDSFDEMYLTLLYWLEQNSEPNLTFASMLISGTGSHANMLSCHRLKEIMGFDQHLYAIDTMIAAGVKEGLICYPKNKFEFQLACQTFLLFTHYLMDRNRFDGVDMEQARMQCREAFIKILN